MNRNVKKLIEKMLAILIVTSTAVYLISTFKPIVANKMALLQLENSNTSYFLYKIFTEQVPYINLVIVLISVCFALRILGKEFKKIKRENEDV